MVEPYYEHDGVTIYHGDCREILPGLEADAVITDPPYGVGFADWDGATPSWWLPLAQVAAPTVAFTTAPTTMWDYPRPDWILCWHRQAAHSRTVWGGFNHWTPVLVYGKGAFAIDVFSLNGAGNARRPGFGHPTPKPRRLMAWLLGGLGGDGVVLDPFMGSGTTLRAAKDLGRKAIGIEIEERYCELAAKGMGQGILAFDGRD